MATTSRIKVKKVFRFILPIFAGFFILLILSTFVTSLLISQRQKEEEKANRSRNLYIDEYNLQIVDFSAKLDEVLELSIKQEPSSVYITELQEVKNLNSTLTELSNDIYQSALIINGLNEEELTKDRIRIENHLVYDNLILSLQNYHELIQSHLTLKSCFEDINIGAKDSVIVENIDTCNKLSSRLTPYNKISEIGDFTKYWDLYFTYWNTVKSIHSKPKTSDIPQLKKKLESDFTALKKQQTVMEDSINTYYVQKYLEQIND